MTQTDKSNNYNHTKIKHLSEHTHLSKFALYTRLKIKRKISEKDYIKIWKNIEEVINKAEEEKKKQLEIDKLEGRSNKFGSPKPIISPLYKQTMVSAYSDGIISATEICKKLSISPNLVFRTL